ncbi:MAG TPA: CopG family antitoxin [Ktedonobacterales bacterium]|nr:CopG family antitoxin [Ktedonobacterales bacterium]
MSQSEKESHIPHFKTIEEEAAFWDRHDSTEFEDEFVEVDDVKFVKASPKKAITVRLEQDSLDDLRKLAREKGIGPSTLARMWILERLRGQDDPVSRKLG